MSREEHGNIGDVVVCTMEGGHNMPMGKSGVIECFQGDGNGWPFVKWIDSKGCGHSSCLRFEQYELDIEPDPQIENPDYKENKASFDDIMKGAL